MPITKHDIPSDPSRTVYPIFWGVVLDQGHQAVSGLEPRDRKWRGEPTATNLSVAQALRRNNVPGKGGGRS
jgi:hypothetical protein